MSPRDRAENLLNFDRANVPAIYRRRCVDMMLAFAGIEVAAERKRITLQCREISEHIKQNAESILQFPDMQEESRARKLSAVHFEELAFMIVTENLLAAAMLEKLAYNAQRADHKPANRALAGGKKF